MNRRPPPPAVTELDPDGLRLSLRERLEFIELRLYWEGRINRGDIAARFGVTLQVATADLNRYQALAPAAIEYDRNAKAYYAAAGFEPRLIRPDAQGWLMQLQALGSGLIAPAQGWLGW
ncbi:MAG TPA: WYL domain-containing protein, partial [Plasticicumulans sp.]|nr:WYL domain-containing protein [Plasticicumulans sp.]